MHTLQMKSVYQATIQDFESTTRFFSKKGQALKWANSHPKNTIEISICTLTNDHILLLLNQEGGYFAEVNLIMTLHACTPPINESRKITYHEPTT